MKPCVINLLKEMATFYRNCGLDDIGAVKEVQCLLSQC